MSEERYHLCARLLQWSLVLGFVFTWGMTTLVADDSRLEEFLFGLHVCIGLTLLALLVRRIAARLVHRPLLMPETIGGKERSAGHLGQAALYALPALISAIGWAETNFAGHAAQWLSAEMMGVFPETGADLQDLSGDLHMWFAYTMLAFAVGHVAAAFKHRWLGGHDVIRRMALGSR